MAEAVASELAPQPLNTLWELPRSPHVWRGRLSVPSSWRTMRTTRRLVVASGIGSGLMLSGAGLGFLSRLAPVSAAEAKMEPSLVRLGNGIESTVKLLEETPRERLIEEVARAVQKGLSYRELLAGLMLAG